MGNIKSLLVEFIVAFLLGIAGSIAIFYIYIYSIDSCGTMVFGVALMTGFPLGSILGIFITKKFLLRTGKFSVLCLLTSLIFGFLAVPLCVVLRFYGLIGPGLIDIIVILLVPLFALIGYNVMGVLLRGRKESPK